MPIGKIAGGIASLVAGGPDLPRRNIGGEVGAWNAALPRVLRGQGFYGPQFQAIQERLLAQGLFGGMGGFSEMPLYRYRRVPGQIRSPITGEMIPNPDPRAGQVELVADPQPIYTPQTRGLLNLVRDVQPELARVREAADPEGLRLLGLLTEDATGLVGRGADPFQDRELAQSLRGAQTARGLAYSPSAALAEVLGLDRARDTRRIQRGQYGVGILGARRGYLGDPSTDALRLLGGVDLTTANQFTNPFNPYAADVANTNFGARAYERIADRNALISGISSIGSGVSGLASMGFGGGLGGLGGLGGAGGTASNLNYLRFGQYGA